MAMLRVREGKLLCYPMAGAVQEQCGNLLSILSALRSREEAACDLVAWVEHHFGVGHAFAAKLVSVIFRGTGFVRREKRRFVLTEEGERIHSSGDPTAVFSVFSRNFAGFADLIPLIGDSQPVNLVDLRKKWFEVMVRTSGTVTSWKSGHLTSQLRFRLDWLRSMGYLELVSGKYLLTGRGLRELTELRKQAAASDDQKLEISHNELENKLKTIGEFFQFVATKRASVNEIIPDSAQKLKEPRQVDCLWVRMVHFGGKIQYAIEVQIAGNISDTIERLEMVSGFVQKAVIVTDPDQEAVITDRLKVKRSALLDKILFVEAEDLDKVLQACNVLKSFTEKMFQS